MTTILDVRSAVERAGGTFFQRDRLRSMKARIRPEVTELPDGSALFIAGYRDGDRARFWRVHLWMPDDPGRVHNVGEPRPNPQAAIEMAQRWAAPFWDSN